MKKTVFMSIVFASVLFAADKRKTTVEFRFQATTYVNGREVNVDIAKLNESLKKKGLEVIPEVIAVDTKPMSVWNDLKRRVENATRNADEELSVAFFEDRYYPSFPTMCYRGPIEGVVPVLDALIGNFLFEEQGVHAFRYGKETVVRNDLFDSEKSLREAYAMSAEEALTAWLMYDTNSKSVLVMSDRGSDGDGTELYARFVKPCK